MGIRVLSSVRNKPRYVLGIFIVTACSYAINRWFFSALVASKWIGLPQYEQAMKELQSQSEKWGIAAVILGIVAIALKSCQIGQSR
jgi:hypothetical protein